MRVLLVSSSSGSRGGGEFFLLYLGEALKHHGVEVGLWISSDPQMDDLAKSFEGVGTVLRNPYKNTFLRKSRSFSHLLPLPKDMNLILEQWKAFAPDVLHLNKQCLEDGLDLLELANQWDKPRACTVHITQTAVELKAVLGLLRDWVARRALKDFRGGLWAISQQRAEELGAFVGLTEPAQYIPNGVQVPDWTFVLSERKRMRDAFNALPLLKSPIAVSVGRLEEQKNPFRFLEIMAQWKSIEPDLSGIWVGDGRLREAFEEKILQMGAKDWIHCAGWQSDPLPFLCMADVYVHPARFEGLPFALLEAMAHGLPCVLSPSLANELKDMPMSTWIIAEEDSTEWLSRLKDSSGLEDLGRNSRHLVEEVFSLPAMARAYIRLYENLIPSQE